MWVSCVRENIYQKVKVQKLNKNEMKSAKLIQSMKDFV